MHPFSIPAHVERRIVERRGRLHPFEAIDPARTALVVIDMQNAFLAPGAPVETPSARALVPNINRLAAATRSAGGTVAWVSVHVNRADEWPVYCNHMLSRATATQLIASLTEGSEGHALWPALQVQPGDLRVPKTRFSAFLPSACALPSMLRERGIDTVLVTGTLTSVCCESSARDAAMQDFKAIMVSDANATRTDEEHAAALIAFLQSFGDVRTTDESIGLLERGMARQPNAAATATT
jgi:ureidoacrylate peracid hydrolase